MAKGLDKGVAQPVETICVKSEATHQNPLEGVGIGIDLHLRVIEEAN